jgi:hypothetical protein
MQDVFRFDPYKEDIPSFDYGSMPSLLDGYALYDGEEQLPSYAHAANSPLYDPDNQDDVSVPPEYEIVEGWDVSPS